MLLKACRTIKYGMVLIVFAGEETMIGGDGIYAALMLLIMALALQAGVTARANG